MYRNLMFLLAIGFAAPAFAQTAEDLDRKTTIEALDENATPAQTSRKARSISKLQKMGIPVLDTLPVLPAEVDTTRRTERAVVDRALALMIVAVKGETGDQALTQTVIAQFGAVGLFTPQEQAFIDTPDPAQNARINMTWRYEGVAVLLWSVGLLPDLPPPDQIIDASLLGEIFRINGADRLLRKARLRPQSELLDAADLAYRMNWAAVNARVSDKPTPEGLHPGITFERHYAFNWLYGYMGLNWDDMRTDT